MRRIVKTTDIRRNLLDAGCCPAEAERFMALRDEGNRDEQMRLLRTHRAALLKNLRDSQKKIDCLDYLVFTISTEIHHDR